mgnify:FL=1
MGRETGARREEGSQGLVGEGGMNESLEENSNKYLFDCIILADLVNALRTN